MAQRDWIAFEPDFPQGSNAADCLLRAARQIQNIKGSDDDPGGHEGLESARQATLQLQGECHSSAKQAFVTALNVLVDLAKQGWEVRAERRKIRLTRPKRSTEASDIRKHIRLQLHAERDEQLRKKSVKSFVRTMETRKVHGERFVSVFSLMRDGRELAECVRNAQVASGEHRIAKLKEAIQPYLQFIEGEEQCSFTGLRLVDIWRYFRHTWASPYKSIPGRTMMLLVRDAAAPLHPVIGIAALSSAPVGLAVRDDHLGWVPKRVLERFERNPSTKLRRWLFEATDSAIEEIYKEDLLADEMVTVATLREPTECVIGDLLESSKINRNKHYSLMNKKDYEEGENPGDLPEGEWEARARTPLFRSKREGELGELLRVRMVLQQALGARPSRRELAEFVKNKAGQFAVRKVVRRLKAERVGTAIAELTICGAVPPYSELLGGKLVAMLAVSPEVVAGYRKRYGKTPSIIASSMSGRPIIRPSELVFIGTSSLYGTRPNQYDRVSIPCHQIQAQRTGVIRYKYLGKTKGIGTFQFGEGTVREMELLLSRSKRGQKVHSIFGEGASPRLRKIRDGLDTLGLSADEFLEHGAPRVVYGVTLASNVADYLLGIHKRPKYLLGTRHRGESTQKIADWWMKRWLARRVAREDILAKIARHTLVHPIRHGARVELPPPLGEQGVLFE